jgi:hypothetical protein
MQRKIDSNLPSSCAVCCNLDYDLFESGDEYGGEHGGINPTRYLTLKFESLRASAEKGCSTCDIINRGIRLFWGDYPENSDGSSDDSDTSSDDLDESSDNDDKTYRFCLERRPGKSLRVFRFNYELCIPEIRRRMEFFTENGI